MLARLSLFLLPFLLLACKRDPSPPHSPQAGVSSSPSPRPSPPPSLPPEEAPLPSPPRPLRSDWLTHSWLSSIQADPGVLKPFFGAENRGTGTYQDARDLWKNQYPAALARPAEPSAIDDTQRILRTRIHLEMADLYQQNDSLVRHLLLETGQRRLLLASKIQLGSLFRFYWGRLLCILDRTSDAIPALEAALPLVPEHRKQRVQLWLSVCRTPHAQRSVLSPPLAKLSWDNDPDGLADWIFVHLFFQIPSQHTVQPSTPRARLAFAVWKQHPSLPPLAFLSEPVDQEIIKENNIDATIEYYDPALSWLLTRYHAHQALRYLLSLQSPDGYTPFFRAKALLLLNQTSDAKAAFQSFLAQPPSHVSLPWLLYSSSLGPSDLRDEATTSLALLLRSSDPKHAHTLLDSLSKDSFPSALWAGFGSLLLSLPSKPNAFLPREAVASIDLALPSLQKQLESQGPGASTLTKLLRTDRALRRPLYTLATQIALSLGLGDLAARWMEILHQKNEPYTIGGENQPGQILLTSRSYMLTGRLENSNLFFDRNRKLFPLLTQPWALMRMLRIFRGMGGGAIGPKSGG